MTLFKNSLIDTAVKNKIIAGQTILRTNESTNTNEIVLVVFNVLEKIKQAYLNDEEDVYKNYIEDGQFNKQLQKLIQYSPPIINPSLINVPLEELPSKLFDYYSEFIGLSGNEDYYEIDIREIVTKHYVNHVDFNIYSLLNKDFIQIESISNISYDNIYSELIPKINLWVNKAAKKEDVYADSIHPSNEIIKLPKENFPLELLMYIYDLYYFDLFINAFYGETLKIFEYFKNINFVSPETENAISFNELSNFNLSFGSLKEYVAEIYYNYRFKMSSTNNSILSNSKLSKVPLEEVYFTFDEKNSCLANINNYKYRALLQLQHKNINGYLDSDIRNLKSTILNLSKTEYEEFSNLLKIISGIKDPLNFEYYTSNIIGKVNNILTTFKQKVKDKEYKQENYYESLGYLNYSDEIKEMLNNEIKRLSKLINIENEGDEEISE